MTTGTVMESRHIKLHKWLLDFYLMSSSKRAFQPTSYIGRSGSPISLHGSSRIACEKPWRPAD